MALDPIKNFAITTVATAPSPASTGTTLVVASGDGALFPDPSTVGDFNVVIFPYGEQPDTANAEIVRVTGISTDTLTIIREQEDTSARTIIDGDVVMMGITKKIFDDVQESFFAWEGEWATSTVYGVHDVVRYNSNGYVCVTAHTSGTFTTDLSAGKWELMWEGGSGTPTGAITMFGGSTAPDGYLLCDGGAVSRSTYSDLFTAIGTTYGIGDGSTTFNVPDLKGRVPVGYNSADTSFDILGETGGEKTHQLATTEMPTHTHIQDSHNHTQNAHNHGNTGNQSASHTHNTRANWSFKIGTGTTNTVTGGSSDSRGNATDNQSASHTHAVGNATATNQSATAVNQNAGGDTAHNNLQPYITLNFVIKT